MESPLRVFFYYYAAVADLFREPSPVARSGADEGDGFFLIKGGGEGKKRGGVSSPQAGSAK